MDDEYSPLLTVGKMEQLVYLFSTASWTDFPCVYLAFSKFSPLCLLHRRSLPEWAEIIEAPSSPLSLPVGIALNRSPQ